MSVITPDATLTTSWFSGTRDEFVEAAKKMKTSPDTPARARKHTVTNPWVRLAGLRAAAEHDLILYQRRLIDGVELDFTTWSRVLALLEKRDGAWRIWKRTNIYEKDRMDPYKPDEGARLVLRTLPSTSQATRRPSATIAGGTRKSATRPPGASSCSTVRKRRPSVRKRRCGLRGNSL